MIVRTVQGDISPDALGATLSHEHLYGQPPPEFAEPDLVLASEADAVSELRDFAAAGGGALVEMTTADYGRDVRALQRVSKAAGVHVVAATGFNKAKFADRYSEALSEDELTEWLVAEVLTGIHEPPPFVSEAPSSATVRAGVIKGSSSLNGPTRAEEKVLRAAARAHAATGAPVGTHTEKATWAVEQASSLLENGVKPDKLLIGHLDFKPDLAFLSELASLGVYLGLDQVSKTKYLADETRADLVVALFEAGYGRQLLLSGDLARRSYWSVAGGAGFRHVLKGMRRLLEQRGLSEWHTLFVDNPRRWLSFVPARA